MRKKIGLLILASMLFIIAFAMPAFGVDSVSVQDSLNEIVSYYENNRTELNDWEVIGLANSGVNLSVKPWQLPEYNLDSGKASAGDYAKAILAIRAVGQDPTDVNGRNLCEELANKQDLTDGHFGVWFTDHIWSVVALDVAGGTYNVSDAIAYIINNKKSDGGYSVSGTAADPDTTGFALIALAKHTEITGVSEAINEAKDCLHDCQLDTAESNSAVIRGLLACGFDEIITSKDWTKNGNTMIDALYAFQLDDKSFAHELEGKSNRMATYQSLLAITDLAHSGFGDYLINGSNSDNEEEPSGQIGVTVRVEGLQDTGTILDETEVEIAAGSKLFDALKQALDTAGIINNIDTTGDWLNTGDINVNIPEELSSSLNLMYVVNDDINTGLNPELSKDDKVTVFLSEYPTTNYAKLTVNKEAAKKGDIVTVTVEKSDGGWPATYIPAAGVTVHFGNETYTTDANGQAAVTIQATGTFDIYAEKYNGSGIPEIVKTARRIVAVNEGSSGSGSGSSTITVSIAVVGKDGNLLYRPGSVQISKNDEFGLTAMSALEATRLSYEFSNRNDGMVVSIAGQSNEGMNGWCGKVNNSSFWDVPKEIPVAQGDKIIFWYSLDANFDGPEWDDLLSGKTGQITSNVSNLSKEEIRKILNSYRDELNDLLRAVDSKTGTSTSRVLNADSKMNQTKAKDLIKELADNKVDITATAGRTEAVPGDTEVSMLVPENALSQNKNLTIQELDSDQEYAFGLKLGSSIYEFGPAGTKFDKPVTISIKVPITEELDINNLAPAWYDAESQQWIPIPAVIDLEKGLVVFQIDHFTKFAVIQKPETIKVPEVISVPKRITFADVNEDMAWAQDAIEILAGKGIIKGTGQALFEPQRPISRSEFVQMLVTALQLKTEPYKEGLFNDVYASNWFAAAVATAHRNQIVSGYPDGSFKPGHSISRNEIASIFYQIEGRKNSITVKPMYDDLEEIPVWALNGVRFTHEYGLMSGYEDGTFRGEKPLTRAEAAVVLYKYINSMVKL